MNGFKYIYELCLEKQLFLHTEELGTVYIKLEGREGVHRFPYEVYFNLHYNKLKQETCEALMSAISDKKKLGNCSCQTDDKGIRFLIKEIVNNYEIIPGFSLDFTTAKSLNLPTNQITYGR